MFAPGRVHETTHNVVSAAYPRSRLDVRLPSEKNAGEIIVGTPKGVLKVTTPKFKMIAGLVRETNFGQPRITIEHAIPAAQEAERIRDLLLEKRVKWRVTLKPVSAEG